MNETTVDEAREEVQAAEAALTDLENSILDGDSSATAATVDKARSRISFAHLQLKGAEKRRQPDELREVQAAIREANAEREAFYADGIQPAAESYNALVTAIRQFREQWTRTRETYAQIGSRARDVGAPLDQDARWLFEIRDWDAADGSLFIREAAREAGGGVPAKLHIFHSPDVRAEFEERQAAAMRDQEQRERTELEAYTPQVVRM